MKTAVIAFTEQGVGLGARILDVLRSEGHEARGFAPKKRAKLGFSPFASVGEAVRENFDCCGCLVFVGACGIAVRAVAPYLKDKATDPAIVVCDETGRFVIPLLSGHLGGANELANLLARAIGALPVITTATDLRGVFAVDVWAKRAGLAILNKDGIKEVSSRLLCGEKVGFSSRYPVRGTPPAGICGADREHDGGFGSGERDGQPSSISGESHECGILVGDGMGTDKSPFAVTLHLTPKNLVAGCGCRKGVSKEQVERAFEKVFEGNGLALSRLSRICSIDLKANEQGLLEFARARRLEIVFYSAKELARAEGTFTPSEVVLRVTGVDNVCERAAVLGGEKGRLIVPKSSLDGVTVAVFEKDWVVDWDA